MQSEGSQTTEAQSPQAVPHATTLNMVNITQSAFCVVYMGQIVINVPRLFPAREPLRQLDWSHWAWVVLVAGFGLFSAYWLGVFALAHASNPKWGEPIYLFGGSILLSLTLLEWGVLRPWRVAHEAVRALKGGV